MAAIAAVVLLAAAAAAIADDEDDGRTDAERIQAERKLEKSFDKWRSGAADGLEALIHDAERVGLKTAGRALREHMAQLHEWSLRPTGRASRPPADKPIDFLKAQEKWWSIKNDPKLTEVQKDKAEEKFFEEHEGAPATVSVKVVEVKADRTATLLTGSVVHERTMYFWFQGQDDVKKLEQVKRGSTVVVLGKIRKEGGEPRLLECRLGK